MRLYKKWFYITFFSTALLMILYGLTIYFIDPYQYFRKQNQFHPLIENERNMNQSLIRHCDYDTAIVGSSMVENFIRSNVNSTLNCKSIKIPLSGGSAYEYKFLLSLLECCGKAKSVILGLDYFSLEKDVKHTYFAFPFYLYEDKNIINALKYLLNFKSLEESIDMIFKNRKKDLALFKFDACLEYTWFELYKFSEINALADYERALKSLDHFSSLKYDNMVANFEENIFPFMEKNQDFTYFIFLPPYSILTWKIYQKAKSIEEIFRFRLYLASKLKKYKNIKLFDFQAIEEIVCNLNKFKDISHYSEEINKQMIIFIKENKYLISSELDINKNSLLISSLLNK